MRKILRSIKPYFFYLICEGKKKIEIGKDFPKTDDWNKEVELYCSKDKTSFNRIPHEHRAKYRKYLGRVGAKFTCNKIDTYPFDEHVGFPTPAYDGDPSYYDCGAGYWITCGDLESTCLTEEELMKYGNKKSLYGWHITNLVIYEKRKELFKFLNYNKHQTCLKKGCFSSDCWVCPNNAIITKAPQSWCYVEEDE